MSNLIIICGPTATGKTELAVQLAKKIKGEIISADSRQIYQGMDIGTGKDLPKNAKFQSPNNKKYKIGYYLIRNIPLWLYDIIQPNQTFSSFEYAKIARVVIDHLQERNKIPIIVGGTGFYIKTLLDGIDTEGIKPDWMLRKKLKNLEIDKLRERLKKIDPNKLSSMNNSDKNNPRRLVRAIEIARKIRNSKFLPSRQAGEAPNKSLAKPDPAPRDKIQNPNYDLHGPLFIGLTASKKILYERIDKRVEKRIKQGIVDEIKNLFSQGYKWSDPGFNTLGYKEWQPYLENKAAKEEVVQRWKLDERNFAKRQLTWFKKDKRIKWFDIEKINSQNILARVLRLLK